MNKKIKILDDALEVIVRVPILEDSVYLSVEEIALLFQVKERYVLDEIYKIFKSKELKKTIVVKKALKTIKNQYLYYEEFYNLEVVIALSFKLNSKKAKVFRKYVINKMNAVFLTN
ncbi:hypothetical protein [Mycoplasma sp. P36-A1]|uniref:hypothetical protein n=1 Tax=Mycoplasma sp. P36-A1 TaxID=3252900 RepID=UPI003C2FEFC8